MTIRSPAGIKGDVEAPGQEHPRVLEWNLANFSYKKIANIFSIVDHMVSVGNYSSLQW